MRLFYYYPYYPRPAGGLKQIRLQAELLHQLGHEVYLIRDTESIASLATFDDNHFYNIEVPNWQEPFSAATAKLSESDILILPEYDLTGTLARCATTKARIVINNQNGFHALEHAPKDGNLLRQISLVIANSPYNCTVSRLAYRVPADRVFYVPHWIIRDPFLPQLAPAFGSKKPGICFMPRKRGALVHRIREKVQSLHPTIPWVEIENIPERQVAGLMREYQMFFAAHHQEGCPLTALEAMACGSVVAGFGGTERFTHPYATPGNGYWADSDNDADSAIRRVSEMIRDVQSNPAKIHPLLARSLATIEPYSKPRVLAGLTRLVEGLTVIASGPDSSSRLRHVRGPRLPEERWRLRDWLFTFRKQLRSG
jgi:glycosyltransferase involved in cell wall biosynthesis